MSPVEIDDEVWSALEKAMVTNNYVSFKYLGGKERITVAPWQLIFSEGMWTLYAHNTAKNGIRFYNLPHIRDIKIEAATFELPRDFEYTKRAKGNFRRYIGKETHKYKIRITSEHTLAYIKTYKWAADQKFKNQDDGSTLMTFTSNQDYPILGWLLSHGMYAEPLEPAWLVDAWQKNVRAMMENCK